MRTIKIRSDTHFHVCQSIIIRGQPIISILDLSYTISISAWYNSAFILVEAQPVLFSRQQSALGDQWVSTLTYCSIHLGHCFSSEQAYGITGLTTQLWISPGWYFRGRIKKEERGVVQYWCKLLCLSGDGGTTRYLTLSASAALAHIEPRRSIAQETSNQALALATSPEGRCSPLINVRKIGSIQIILV